MLEMTPLFGGLPGGPELLVIVLIAVLLFGANKIPKLARSTGEAMGEFKKGREEVEQELQGMREGVTGGDSTDTAGGPAGSSASETTETTEPGSSDETGSTREVDAADGTASETGR